MKTKQITDKHLQSDLFNKGLTGSPLEQIIEGCLRASSGSALDNETELLALKDLLNHCIATAIKDNVIKNPNEIIDLEINLKGFEKAVDVVF